MLDFHTRLLNRARQGRIATPAIFTLKVEIRVRIPIQIIYASSPNANG